MKFVFRLLLIIIFCFLAERHLPWWSIAFISFIFSFLITGNYFSIFVSGFLGVGILWAGMAWKIDYETQSILTEQIAALFNLEENTYLILLTGVVGGIVGGLAAVAGNSLRRIFIRPRESEYYS